MDITERDLLRLRGYIGDPLPGSSAWTDPELTDLLQETGSVLAAAEQVWRSKAAAFATLTDVTEGNSTRKLSALYDQALKMAANLAGEQAEVVLAPSRPTSRAIARG